MLCISRVFALAALTAARAEVPRAGSTTPTCDGSTDASSLLQVANAGRVKGHKAPPFALFIQQHNRNYENGSLEYEHRRSIYDKRAREADSHNARPARLWTAGMNHLADWTEEELSALCGWKGVAGRRKGKPGATVSGHGSGMSLLQTRVVDLPDEVSWAHLNASNVFHDQGSCGSCWAMASALMLETNHEIHQKNSRTFSAQELVDCVSNSHNCGGTGGCAGNVAELAIDYAMKHGLNDNTAVPYTGADQICSQDVSLVADAGNTNSDSLEVILAPGVHTASDDSKSSVFGLIGWERLPENKYEPLMRALVERGPAAVSVDATPWASYSHGVFNECDSDAVINHAVLLLGYGKDDGLGEKFWLIQNSWGRNWGEGGRIRILRQDSDETHCGTDRHPELGTACDGGPKEVTVCGHCGILFDTVVPHFSKAD